MSFQAIWPHSKPIMFLHYFQKCENIGDFIKKISILIPLLFTTALLIILKWLKVAKNYLYTTDIAPAMSHCVQYRSPFLNDTTSRSNFLSCCLDTEHVKVSRTSHVWGGNNIQIPLTISNNSLQLPIEVSLRIKGVNEQLPV